MNKLVYLAAVGCLITNTLASDLSDSPNVVNCSLSSTNDDIDFPALSNAQAQNTQDVSGQKPYEKLANLLRQRSDIRQKACELVDLLCQYSEQFSPFMQHPTSQWTDDPINHFDGQWCSYVEDMKALEPTMCYQLGQLLTITAMFKSGLAQEFSIKEYMSPRQILPRSNDDNTGKRPRLFPLKTMSDFIEEGTPVETAAYLIFRTWGHEGVREKRINACEKMLRKSGRAAYECPDINLINLLDYASNGTGYPHEKGLFKKLCHEIRKVKKRNTSKKVINEFIYMSALTITKKWVRQGVFEIAIANCREEVSRIENQDPDSLAENESEGSRCDDNGSNSGSDSGSNSDSDD